MHVRRLNWPERPGYYDRELYDCVNTTRDAMVFQRGNFLRRDPHKEEAYRDFFGRSGMEEFCSNFKAKNLWIVRRAWNAGFERSFNGPLAVIDLGEID